LRLLHELVESPKDFAKVGRSAKLNLGEHLPVSLQDPLDTRNVRILWVAVQRKAVTDLIHAHVHRDSTKAESRELPSLVVRLKDSSYLLDSLLILVELVHRVERLRAREHAIRSREIDSHTHLQGPA